MYPGTAKHGYYGKRAHTGSNQSYDHTHSIRCSPEHGTCASSLACCSAVRADCSFSMIACCLASSACSCSCACCFAANEVFCSIEACCRASARAKNGCDRAYTHIYIHILTHYYYTGTAHTVVLIGSGVYDRGKHYTYIDWLIKHGYIRCNIIDIHISHTTQDYTAHNHSISAPA